MTQESQIPPPPVMWAQRKDILYVTICLEDCKDPVIDIEPEKIYFRGEGGTDKKMHEVTINLYKEIEPSKTIKNLKGRTFELILAKKEEGPYWPRLIKDKTKAHWLKSDFNKWKDEDDTDEESSPPDLEEMMRQMGGLSGSSDSKPNFDDLDELGDNDADSDDEDLPDLYD